MRLVAIAMLASFFSCENDSNGKRTSSYDLKVHFDRVAPVESGVTFSNTTTEDSQNNYLIYDGFYQGAGVGVGDINNDGLPDLFFAGNMVPDKLYLNKGDFNFEDITATAGIEPHDGWSTGVSFADVNGDGFQDIYVCLFLWQDPTIRANKLYINNGDLTFTEQAEAFGVADIGFSIQGAFFDYDRDGDMDLYVVNQPPNHRETRKMFTNVRDYRFTGKLYRNESGRGFTDVTVEAEIYNFGFGLSAVPADLNNDGWVDLYCAFDYVEPDLLFYNNGDGTFREVAGEALAHMSNFSMGADVGDINNDKWLDVFVADMVAPGHERIKTQMSGMNPERFYALVNAGYHHQYMFNAMQINNGNGRFSEISQLAGVGNTDWSWTALFMDVNLDGYQELFVSNGIKRDVRDNDNNIAWNKFLGELKEEGKVDAQGQPVVDALTMLEMTPSTKLANFMFMNNGDYTFENMSESWGFGEKGWSHGGLYADLDNDGDLDLVLNNMDEPAGIYRNNSTGNANYLVVNATRGGNPALNTRVEVSYGDESQLRDITSTRGYMSSSQPIAHFGLKDVTVIDEVRVLWLDGTETVLNDVPSNQTLEVEYNEAERSGQKPEPAVTTIFQEQNAEVLTHVENEHNDFEDEILLPHKVSTLGPAMDVADVNGDQLDDMFVGGSKGTSGSLLIQSADGSFNVSAGPWNSHASSEDLGVHFVDIEGDGDMDLFVASGGNEEPAGASYYTDRLYINEGNGSFSNGSGRIPQIRTSTGAIASGDYDQDGDLDLFIGGRQTPKKWPYPATSYLLVNDGEGNFTDANDEVLHDFGMVTDARWVQLDDDPELELVTCGEWMPITVLDRSANGNLTNSTEEYGLQNTQGWWNALNATDIDGDGDLDLIAGNLGNNIKYKASAEEPFKVYSADFDENGSNDIYLGYYEHGDLYPVRGRQCSSQQMPFIKEKFETYNAFANATVEEILGPNVEGALILEATTFESAVFVNNGDGSFKASPLPNRAQFSTIQDMILEDFDSDGDIDMLIAGNYYNREVETRASDGSVGLLLLNDGEGNFKEVSPQDSGFNAFMDARALGSLRSTNGGKIVVVANNNAPIQIYQVQAQKLNM